MLFRSQRTPTVRVSERATLHKLDHGIMRVMIEYGFMEQPDLPVDLALALSAEIRLDSLNTTFFLGHETVRVAAAARWWQRLRRHLFATMLRDEASAADYFGLPPNQVVEIGAQVVL